MSRGWAALHPELAVKTSVLDGFGNVSKLNPWAFCEVSNRPGDLGGVNAM